jgi:predicted nuclease of predicted toxin-antitoxin system
MRWLLDQGLPLSAATLLCDAGDDAVHVGQIGMAEAEDSQILLHALQENRVVVTLDADFHSLLARSSAKQPSVIRIREEGLKGPELAKLISQISSQFRSSLESGCVMTYLDGKIRYRSLPL